MAGWKKNVCDGFELPMIAYGSICTFILVYYLSQSIFLSICMVPAGIGGICIALIFNRQFLDQLTYTNNSLLRRVAGVSIIPAVVLIVCVYAALDGRWEQAGANFMLLGFAVILALQQFLTTRNQLNLA